MNDITKDIFLKTIDCPTCSDIHPFEQVPTQYSIHKCSSPGNIINQMEYLADAERDCRRELAENLIKSLEEEGSVIVYSTFEKTIITKLSGLCPDLSETLNAILNRLVDLEKIIRNNYYHPDFHGSTSIKKTLPVLVPGMSYKGMEIGEGDTAMTAFAMMATGKCDRNEAERMRENLLAYCKQDTMAMVQLHGRLAGIGANV